MEPYGIFPTSSNFVVVGFFFFQKNISLLTYSVSSPAVKRLQACADGLGDHIRRNYDPIIGQVSKVSHVTENREKLYFPQTSSLKGSGKKKSKNSQGHYKPQMLSAARAVQNLKRPTNEGASHTDPPAFDGVQ